MYFVIVRINSELNQITLRLPIDNNNPHKDILEFDSLIEDYPAEEHRELKRSDAHVGMTKNVSATNYGYNGGSTIKNHTNSNQNKKINIPAIDTSNEHHRFVPAKRYQQQEPEQQFLLNTKYDKVLLTPQDQYIPTLPKVIITASASVTDASGKKLNYSVGNVIASSNIKLPPSTYDEYHEDDVNLDPFFLDVPKILPRRNKQNLS